MVERIVAINIYVLIMKIMESKRFDDIRPYNAEEIPGAMQRIAYSSSFPILAAYVYPGEPLEVVRKRIAG